MKLINRENINNIFKIYCFFSLVLIITIKYDYMYLSTILGAINIFVIYIYNIKNGFEKSSKKIRIFKNICYIYCIYTMIITILLGNFKTFIYSVNKLIPIILICSIITYFTEVEREKLRKYISKLILFVIALYFILAIFNIAYVRIGLDMHIDTFADNLRNIGETRFSGLMSHKARLGIYCILCFFIIVNEIGLNKIGKISTIILLILSYLSDSVTTLMFFIISIFGYVLLKNYKTAYKKLKTRYENFKLDSINAKSIIIIILGFISLIIIGIILFINVEKITNGRDFSTLGSRTEIWKYSIEHIQNNPIPKIKIPHDFALNGITYYNNSHNIFLNEIMETGIVGGIIYIIIYIYSIIIQKGITNKFILICILIAAQFDKMISNELMYIYWLIIAMYIETDECKMIERNS